MGWSAKGSVQHTNRRNRIFHSLLHFERFWRALTRFLLKILIFLFGFERFWRARFFHLSSTLSVRVYRGVSKTAQARKPNAIQHLPWPKIK